MRIAMLAHANAGWTAHYLRHFDGMGHTVRVISFSPAPLAHSDVIRIDGDPKWGIPKLAWFLTRLPEVRRALREFRPDVVLATYLSSNGLTAALTWSGPLVVSARGGDILRQAGYLPAPEWLLGPMMRFVCGRAAEIHAVSEELAEALAGFGVSRDRITCFPLGVPLDRLTPRSPRDPAAPLRVICTRRHEDVYGNGVLIEALALLRDEGTEMHATFVGGGPLLASHTERTRALNLLPRVTFAGEVGPDDLPGLLRAADIYVSASSSDGTSSSLLEAMACGLFPVVSDIRANRPWVDDGKNGLLFAVGDAASLAGALRDAGARRASFHDVARVNRRRVEENGDLRANSDKLLGLLESAYRKRR